MSAMKTNRAHYWIGVVSKDHVDIGVAGGFTQVNHGKAGPLERMHAGDGFAFYSPRTTYPDGESLQAFTAIGRIRNGNVYQVTVGELSSFPSRRRLLPGAAGAGAPADRRALVHSQQDPLGRGVSLRRVARAGGRLRADRPRDGPLVRRRFRRPADSVALLDVTIRLRYVRRDGFRAGRRLPRLRAEGAMAVVAPRRTSRPRSSTPCSPRASRCSPSSSIARSRTPTVMTSMPGISSRGTTPPRRARSRGLPARARSGTQVRGAIDRAGADGPAVSRDRLRADADGRGPRPHSRRLARASRAHRRAAAAGTLLRGAGLSRGLGAVRRGRDRAPRHARRRAA